MTFGRSGIPDTALSALSALTAVERLAHMMPANPCEKMYFTKYPGHPLCASPHIAARLDLWNEDRGG